jgi:hypothetical protein
MVTRLTAAEKAGLERSKKTREQGLGYSAEQTTQPQTLSYGLADSPVGLLGWIYEKLVNWTDDYPWTDAEGLAISLSVQDAHLVPLFLVLTWISIYWFSRAGPAASLRIYYEHLKTGGDFVGPKVSIPTGYSFFPKDMFVFPR